MPATNAAAQKSLYYVTLPWNDSDSDEGDYSEYVWATSHAEAERLIAEEMAEHEDSHCTTDIEKRRFVDNLVGEGDVTLVVTGILSDLHDLMKDPEGNSLPSAKEDYEAIQLILSKYDPAAAPKKPAQAKT